MRASAFFNQLQQQIEEIKSEGLYKNERIITSQQQAKIEVASGDKVINFCA
ncbi:MAG: glycine C-acetyltransferase, partial [Pseudoalteromonas sp.]